MFKISQRGSNWVLSLVHEHELQERYDRDYSNWYADQLNKIVVELSDNEHARRMAYDQWWWRNRTEMEKFITYWTLKQGQQK